MTDEGRGASWFIGLPVPPEGWFPGTLGSVPAGLRLLAPSDLHLTVAFLGACGEPRARQAFDRAGEWSLGRAAVSLASLVPLGPSRRWSALSWLLDEGRDELREELARVRDVWAEAAGMAPERREPLPHITVARPRRGATEEERQHALSWAAHLRVPAQSLRLGPPALYTWSEDRRERLFRIVERS